MHKKIIISIVVILFLIGSLLIGYTIYSYHQILLGDQSRPTIARVESGSATIVRGDTAYDLGSGEEIELQSLDRVLSHEDSRTTILWSDQSISRLGSESEITIHELSVNRDLSEVGISFSLDQGRIWTRVVRTLFGESHFETSLPDYQITAAIRGTVYEIDREAGYIHGVEHMIELSDTSDTKKRLLPGDIVSTQDIWKSLPKKLLDTAWIEMNITADRQYIDRQTQEWQEKLSRLTRDTWLDRTVRSGLSGFEQFDGIKVAESLAHGGGLSLSGVRVETLRSWYQSVANLDTLPLSTRQSLRESLSLKDLTPSDRSVLLGGAIWDRLSLSGVTLPEMDRYIDRMHDLLPAESRGWYKELDLPGVRSRLDELDQSLQQKLRDTIQGVKNQ